MKDDKGLLRQSRYIWAKSAYAIEINPWIQREESEAALLFRGTVVSAYAYIETRLTEIAIRASRMPVYAELREKYPYQMNGRLKFLRQAFAIGALAPYGSIAESFFSRFEDAATLRHVMAHARMEMGPKDWGVTFYDYRPGENGAIMFRRNRYTYQELERFAWRASRLSRLAQNLAHRLEGLGILPAPEY